MYDDIEDFAEERYNQKNRRAARIRSKKRYEDEDFEQDETFHNLDSRIGTLKRFVDGGVMTIFYCYIGSDMIEGTREHIESILGV